MHLLTSMVVGELLMGAGLLRGRRPKRPTFELAHVLPGRIRVRVASLRGDAVGSERLRGQIAQLDGVTGVRCDHRTGSVLVLFDDSPALRQSLIDTFDRLAEQTTSARRDGAAAELPEINRQLIEIGRALNQRVREASAGKADLEGLLAAALIGYGVKTLISPAPTLGRWQGMTLVYWAYNIMRRAAAATSVGREGGRGA